MDPIQRKHHDIMLMIGYVLIGFAILLITTILVFVAYGFGYKNGVVTQSGLVFVSSTPNPAQIYINGKRYGNDTNTRISLTAGTYNFNLQRPGYRNWQRTVVVQGGQVVRFDYPFLFPSSLTTSTLQSYVGVPALVTQSPDRRWLVVARPGSLKSFDVYDLKNPKNEPVVINLPDGLLAAGTSQSLQLINWSDDNNHFLLKHTYDGNTEYILADRTDPTQSLNLTKTLALPTTGTTLDLSNLKYDQYFIFDSAKQTLSRANLSSPQLQPYVSKMLAYKSYGDNTILYATPDPGDATKVDIDLYDGSHTYTIRDAAANTIYLLDLTKYSGNLYVAIAASSEGVAYVYENPANQIDNQQLGVAVPVQVLRIKAPNYVSFSDNTQYVTFENGTSFATYDIENQLGYTYTTADPLDAPQAHANWMDGARLDYVSGGQVEVFDYDGTNRQTLVSASPSYAQYFDPNYKFLYTLVPSAANKSQELLTSTLLRTPSDQ